MNSNVDTVLLVVMEFSAFIDLYAGDGTALLPAAEIFLKVKDITRGTGYIQFFRID